MSRSALSIQIEDSLATIRLSRPNKRNALHLELVNRIGRFFAEPPPDGVKEAASRADREATKAQIYAAHLPASEAPRIIALAHAAASGRTLPDHVHASDAARG